MHEEHTHSTVLTPVHRNVVIGWTALASALPATASAAVLPAASASLEEDAVSADDVRRALESGWDEAGSWTALLPDEVRTLAAREEVKSSENLRLSTENAQAWRLDSETTMLRVPVDVGQDAVAGISSVNVFIDGGGSATDVVEFVLTPLSPDAGNVRTWVNGVVVTDRTVGAPATEALEIGAFYTKGDWWGNFLECMNGAGVSSWLVSAISVACSTICVLTAGAGCVACLAAAAAGTGGAVGACITVASNHT